MCMGLYRNRNSEASSHYTETPFLSHDYPTAKALKSPQKRNVSQGVRNVNTLRPDCPPVTVVALV
jgi:hypothetical protein